MHSLHIRTKERIWFCGTVLCAGAACVIICTGMLYAVTALVGLQVTKRAHDEEEVRMRFSRVAWLARTACNGLLNETVNIHCPTAAAYFNESLKYDPVSLAAATSYRVMAENSTLFSLQLLLPSERGWVLQQELLLHMYHYIIGPWVFMPFFLCAAAVFMLPAYWCMGRLRATVTERKENMARYNHSLEEVMQASSWCHVQPDNTLHTSSTTTTTTTSSTFVDAMPTASVAHNRPPPRSSLQRNLFPDTTTTTTTTQPNIFTGFEPMTRDECAAAFQTPSGFANRRGFNLNQQPSSKSL